MRIRPGDPRFSRMPLAHGAGMHGSELDAAWYDIKDYLPPTLKAEFATQTDVDAKYRRRNSGSLDMGGGEDGAEEDTIMSTNSLYELAMLVTGRWGHLALPSLSVRSTYPSSKVFKKQDTKSTFEDLSTSPSVVSSMTFWDRMSLLKSLLQDRKRQVIAGYDKKGSAASRAKRPWLSVLEDMEDAVDFVLLQKNMKASRRSIFGKVVDKDQRKVVVQPQNPSQGDVGYMPLAMNISALKADGNSKLPFIAYSELPMSTCPGAGECGVYKKDASTGSVVGWCYSFKAWRYPAAFKRQFLTTLANYADREFCILRNNGDDPSDGVAHYWKRIKAAMKEDGPRPWMQYIASQVLMEAADIIRFDLKNGLSPNEKNGGRTVFFRLFVDGDIGQPDSIHSWMEAIKMMASKSDRADAASFAGIKLSHFAPVQVYGYSKCWGEFVALDSAYRGRYRWPENYTLNLSSASIYSKNEAISEAVRLLPISRGGFNAIDFRQHLQSLKGIRPENIVMPERPPLPGVTEKQLRGIVAIESINYTTSTEIDPITGDKVLKLDESSVQSAAVSILREYFDIEVDKSVSSRLRRTLRLPKEAGLDAKSRNDLIAEFSKESAVEIRRKTLVLAMNKMMEDPKLSARVKTEIARDNGFRSVKDFEEYLDDEFQKASSKYDRSVEQWKDAVARGEAAELDRPSPPKRKVAPYEMAGKRGGSIGLTDRQEKKLVALLVHAIFVAAKMDGSGSCPLVCGNCADITVEEASSVYGTAQSFRDFQALTGAVHRCASRVPTPGYAPPEGKRLPDGVEVDKRTGKTKPYRRSQDGKVRLVTGYYGAEIHIGLH